MFNPLRMAAALTLAAVAAAGIASASTFPSISLHDRVVKADMVAYVTVLSVVHHNSSIGGPEHVALPHTFVTVRLEQVLKGYAPGGDELTLRFQGGPDGQGRFLTVAGIPQFEPGDRDILFIKNNGTSMCPLIGWDLSRFRLVDDDVFDAHGREVWITRDGSIVPGPRRVVRDGAVLRRVQVVPSESTDEETEAQPEFQPPVGSVRPDALRFAALLERMVIRSYEVEAMGPAPATRTVRANETFFVERLRPVMPPDRPDEAVMDESEAAERALER